MILQTLYDQYFKKNILSKFEVPRKVKWFLWSLSYKSTNTQDNAQKKNSHITLFPWICMNCRRKDKTINHPFSGCPVVVENWSRLCHKFRIVCGLHEDLNLVFPEIIWGWWLMGKTTITWETATRDIFWLTLTKRNNRTFNEINRNFCSLWEVVQHRTSCWIKLHTASSLVKLHELFHVPLESNNFGL